MACLQVASIMAYQPIPAILDYACTKVKSPTYQEWVLLEKGKSREHYLAPGLSHFTITAVSCMRSIQ
jgi:hypothetical protein